MTPYATDIFQTGATEYRPRAILCIFDVSVRPRSEIVRGAFVAGKVLAFVKQRKRLEIQSFKSGFCRSQMYSTGRSMQRSLILFYRTGETTCLTRDCHRALFAFLSSASRLLILSTSRVSPRAGKPKAKRNRLSLTVLEIFHFIRLKLHPKPIDRLISNHSAEEDLGYGPAKGLVEADLE